MSLIIYWFRYISANCDELFNMVSFPQNASIYPVTDSEFKDVSVSVMRLAYCHKTGSFR